MNKCISVASLAELSGKVERIVVAIGVFDGVHRGHQEIFRQLHELAREKNAVPAVLFFEPFPKTVLFPESAPKKLTTIEQKRKLLAEAGISYSIEMPFTHELAAESPEQFLHRTFFQCKEYPQVVGFCVGKNWHFGCKNSGDAAFLQKLSREYGAEAWIVKPVWYQKKMISSTRIRRVISAGKLSEASEMLGRPVALCGTVIHGLGKASGELQCATANFIDSTLQYPPFGVYAAYTRLWNEKKCYRSIVYIGDAPTIRKNEIGRVVTEIHLLQEKEIDLYGKCVEVALISFLRCSRKFASVEALKQQVAEDIVQTNAVLEDR